MYSVYSAITCYHVIGDNRKIAIVVDGRPDTIVTSVTGFSPKADAIKLDLDTKLGQEVEVGEPDKLKVGDKLYVIGSPRGLGQTMTEGILSARRENDGVPLLQISNPISPGSSGSPVINEFGEVVGIVTSQIRDSQQLNFAVPIWYAIGSCSGVPIDRIKPSGDSPATKTSTSVASTKGSEIEEFWKIQTSHRNSDTDIRCLQLAPDFSVDAGISGKANVDGVDEDDMKRWMTAELSRSAPSANVISDKDQKSRSDNADDANNVLDLISRRDNGLRNLFVSLNILKAQDGLSVYTITINFNRCAVTPYGLAYVSVYEKSATGFFGKAKTPSDVLRDGIVGLVKNFADAWSVANKKTE